MSLKGYSMWIFAAMMASFVNYTNKLFNSQQILNINIKYFHRRTVHVPN